MLSDKNSFSKMNDEELVAAAQTGNLPAEACLLERFKDAAKKTAGVLHSKNSSLCTLGLLDKDDLYQEGLIGLLSAIYSFRSDKNTSFRTYASVCISNNIMFAIRTANSKKNVPFGNLLSIEEAVIPATESVEDSFISNENLEDLYSFINRELSPLELSVVRLFLQDKSYKEISEKLGISAKSVDNAIQRIRTKLKEFLDTDRS